MNDADDFTIIDSVNANNGRDGVLEVPLESGRYFVDAFTTEQSYNIVIEALGGDEPCTQAAEIPGDPPDDPPGDVDDPGDVIKDPVLQKKKMPFTGGPSLLLGAVLLLTTAVAVGSRIIRV